MPHPDGRPYIIEVLTHALLDEHNIEAKSEEVVARLRARLGRLPLLEEVAAELGVQLDDRKDKPWPPEEDCKGCDRHRDGPHRFGCHIGGARAGQLVVPATKLPDGTFQVEMPKKP